MVSPMIALVHAAWIQISKDPNHQDLWLCDETIHRRIRSLHPTLNVNRRAINRALLSVAGSHQKLNILGLYHVMFRTICPYSKQKRDVNYFYRHVRVEPSFPRIQSDVEDIIAKAFRLVEEREISSGDSEKNTNNDDEKRQIAEKETNPGTTNPETMNPEIVIPGTTNPETLLPEIVITGDSNPQIVIPAIVIPGTTNPEITNP